MRQSRVSSRLNSRVDHLGVEEGAAPGEVARYEPEPRQICSGKDVRSWLASPLSLKLKSSLTIGTSSPWPSRAAPDAYDRIVRRYYGFVRLKASSYFLAGGDSDDLVQEGLVGLYKAVRDYRTDRESSFRNFAELCITRQIITAVKTATRNKHTPLNQLRVVLGHAGRRRPTASRRWTRSCPARPRTTRSTRSISSEELRALVACLSTVLSELESRVLGALPRRALLRGRSAGKLGCDAKTVDNALQRVKRKVGAHLDSRAVPA